MHLLLYGEDTFRSREKVRKIREKYLKAAASDINFSKIDAALTTFEELSREMLAMPFLTGKRLVEISNMLLSASAEVQEKCLTLLDQIPDSTVVVFWEQGLPRPSKLFDKLKKGFSEKFEFLQGNELLSWLKKRVVSAGGSISQEAALLLAQITGSDLWRLDNEINKLVNYAGKKQISEEDVRLLVGENGEISVFALVDALAMGKTQNALSAAEKLLNQTETEISLLGRISSQFRNLLIVNDYLKREIPQQKIVAQTGLHPFVVKKLAAFGQKFSQEKLEKSYEKIFEADFALKSGLGEPKVILTKLICDLCYLS